MQFFQRLRKQTPAVEHFFALNLSEEAVRAAVWKVNQGQTEAVKLGGVQNWDGKDKDSLLKAADQSLSRASEGVKPEPNGVIFGLPDTWVDKDAINPQKKGLIKYLCDELELKPLGFVVTDTAIIAYLKQEEGTPLSAVLVQRSASEINLALVKVGKILGNQLVGRSGDLGADVEEGLSRFDKVEALPARIILYNGGGDFEEDKQQLLSYDWEEKLPFIHFPKVEALSSEMTVKAVALAGGSEVAKSLGLEVTETAPGEETAEALGFVAGKDAAEEVKKPEPQPGSEPAPEPQIKPEAKAKFNWQPLLTRLKKIKLPRLRFGARWPLVTGGGLVALLILLFYLYWNIPKASVVLYLDPRVVSEDLEIKLDSQVSIPSPQNNVLPVQLAQKSVGGDKSAETTGTKTIGDPAKGPVTIYNKTASTKTFAAGAVLIGPNKLVFTLDDETTVASRSAEEDSEGVITITPGKADAKITASNIGPESNLVADSRLAFKQFSEDDYYAKTSGLGGGTAREVKAVSQADLDSLEKALTADLIEKAKNELKNSLGQDQQIIERQSNLRLADKNFSAREGEVADELSLTGQLNYEGVVYRRAELDMILKEAIKNKIPENFVISEFGGLKLGNVADMRLALSFEAKLLPRLDMNNIKNNLKGRYPDKVESYLTGLPQFVSADIKITPSLPRALKTLPRVTKNINLEIKPAL